MQGNKVQVANCNVLFFAPGSAAYGRWTPVHMGPEGLGGCWEASMQLGAFGLLYTDTYIRTVYHAA